MHRPVAACCLCLLLLLVVPVSHGQRDWSAGCPRWAFEGQCDDDLEFMCTMCPIACAGPMCDEWLAQSGTQQPAATTTVAPAPALTTMASGGGDANSKDYHGFCCQWAVGNQCVQNAVFMCPMCQKSCGTAGCNLGNYQQYTPVVDTSGCGGGNAVQPPAPARPPAPAYPPALRPNNPVPSYSSPYGLSTAVNVDNLIYAGSAQSYSPYSTNGAGAQHSYSQPYAAAASQSYAARRRSLYAQQAHSLKKQLILNRINRRLRQIRPG